MFVDKKIGRYGVHRFSLVIFATLAVPLAAAQEHKATYTLTGEELEGPEALEAGYHTFTLQNDGDKEAEVVIVQLNEEGAVEAKREWLGSNPGGSKPGRDQGKGKCYA